MFIMIRNIKTLKEMLENVKSEAMKDEEFVKECNRIITTKPVSEQIALSKKEIIEEIRTIIYTCLFNNLQIPVVLWIWLKELKEIKNDYVLCSREIIELIRE